MREPVELAKSCRLLNHGPTVLVSSAHAGQRNVMAAAWSMLECPVLGEPHIQQQYDLFIGEVVAAWADPRLFADGHWRDDPVEPGDRTLHYIAGGRFFSTGEPFDATATPARTI